VLTIGVPASLLLFTIVRDAVDDVAQLRFDRLASDARHVIQARIDSYGEILYGLAALFTSQGSVSRLDFHRYVESLDLKNRFPGFDVVNYAAYVRAENKRHFEETVRRDTSLDPRGYPTFAIKPPGERFEYFVLVYVEPMAGFEFAFGLDTGVNPAVKESRALAAAVHLTRDSGKLNSPGLPIRIKSHGKEYIGLAMRLAVYRSGMPLDTVEQRRMAFVGSVGAGFNVEKLMKGVLDQNTAQYLRFKLYGAQSSYEVSSSRAENKRFLLYDSKELIHAALPSRNGQETIFTSVLPMVVGGRDWEVRFSAPKDAVIDHVDEILSWAVLAGGLLSTMLFFGRVYSLASSRSRAVELADEITKNLRESEAGLKASAEQLQALSRRLVDIQELERRRFSRELHDLVGQNLTALSINLDILRTQLGSAASDALRLRLGDSEALLESTTGAIENVMSELRPPMLDDYGLLPALQWYGNDFTRRTGIEVKIEGEERMARLVSEREIALFRIAQEALNNVAKHARARCIDIKLENQNSHCILSVSDDGVGFDGGTGSKSRRRPGLGMVTMRERTQAIGGTFEVETTPGHGTRITVRVPV
jgi:signal transduction histidine kinase